MPELTPEEVRDGLLMNTREAAEWLRVNWRPLHQQLDAIRERAVQYCVPVDGYMTNMGPNESGVYFLFDDEELVYVGKATRIGKRLWAHFRGRSFYWRFVSWITCRIECAEEVEHFYIRLHKPVFNERVMPSVGHLMAKLVKNAADS